MPIRVKRAYLCCVVSCYPCLHVPIYAYMCLHVPTMFPYRMYACSMPCACRVDSLNRTCHVIPSVMKIQYETDNDMTHDTCNIVRIFYDGRLQWGMQWIKLIAVMDKNGLMCLNTNIGADAPSKENKRVCGGHALKFV